MSEYSISNFSYMLLFCLTLLLEKVSKKGRVNYNPTLYYMQQLSFNSQNVSFTCFLQCQELCLTQIN